MTKEALLVLLLGDDDSDPSTSFHDKGVIINITSKPRAGNF